MISFPSFLKRLLSFRAAASKGLFFAVAWYFLPAWLFIPIAAYLYFVPFFQSSKYFSVFVAIVVFYAFSPTSLGYALLGGVIFGWFVAIREFLFIDRRFAHEVLIFTLMFFLLRVLYLAQNTIESVFLFWSFLLAVLISWLAYDFLIAVRDALVTKRRITVTTLVLFGFFIWQMLCVALVMPLDFIYQFLIGFLLIVGTFDVVTSYLFEDVFRERLFFTVAAVACGLIILLTAAPFGL